MNKESLEHLSSLMDGEMSRETGLFVTRRLSSDDELSETWTRYHLIRDCLRQPGGGAAVPDFSMRVQQAHGAAVNDQFDVRVNEAANLIPLFAVEVLEPEMLERLPVFAKRVDWYFEQRPDLTDLVSHWPVKGKGERRLLSLLRGHRMKCLLRRALDPEQFLSPHGVRSMSKSLPVSRKRLRSALAAAGSTG